MRGLFNLFRSVALISHEYSAHLHERSAVFQKGVQPCHCTRATRIVPLAVNAPACILCTHILYRYAFQTQLVCGILQKGTLFSHALEEGKFEVGAAYFKGNGGKSAAGTHFCNARSPSEIFFARKAVPHVFYNKIFPSRYGRKIDFFVVFCKNSVKLFQLFLLICVGIKVPVLQNSLSLLITFLITFLRLYVLYHLLPPYSTQNHHFSAVLKAV